MVHGASWWPWQGRGQKEPCSCACLQLHLSIGAICVFCRVERRKGGWWRLVLDGPPSASSMGSSAAGQQLHAPRAHSLQMLPGSRNSGSCVWCSVVCGCVWLCVSPCLFSGASSSSSCTSIIMVGGRRRRLSRLGGLCLFRLHSYRQGSRRAIFCCEKLRRCMG